MASKLRILITGSNGMLGVDLYQELSRDYEVVGLDIIKHPAHSGQRFIKCDITDRKGIQQAILKTKPKVVIHAAAWTDVDGCEFDREKASAINVEGTKNVASACRKTGSILIYLSTDYVFDGRKRTPYTETDAPHPLSIYADSKRKGEKAVEKMLKRYFILRTSWLYGRHGRNFVDTILAIAKKKKVIKVVDDQTGSPTYTKDLAKAIHRFLDKVLVHRTSYIVHRYGIYHVSNAGSVSWYGYAKEILRMAGSKTKVVPITAKELGRPARRPAMSVLDNSKFSEFTDYRMRGWKSALREYLKN